MRAFVPVPGGWASELEPVELRLLGRVVADTAELLGERFDEAFFPVGIDPTSVPRLPAGEETEEADIDAEAVSHGDAFDELIAAQGWDDQDDEAPQDPALARLFPPASAADDELADEMRRLTQGRLRTTKLDQLRLVYQALAASRGIILVPRGQEGRWLAALTDVRLVLAVRLGIDTDADAEAVYERVAARSMGERPKEDERSTEDDDLEAALAHLYTAITWWQESLLEAMSRRP